MRAPRREDHEEHAAVVPEQRLEGRLAPLLVRGHNVLASAVVGAIGVLLYELLTGKVPFDPRDLRKSGLVEIQRIIREDAPPRPSTRLTTVEASEISSASRSARDGSSPGAIVGALTSPPSFLLIVALSFFAGRDESVATLVCDCDIAAR